MATGELSTAGPHEAWYAHYDPVLRLARSLAGGGAQAVERLFALDGAIRKRIGEAVEFALASPLPAPETALDHVFAPGAAS